MAPKTHPGLKPHRIRIDEQTYLSLEKLKTSSEQDLGDVVADLARQASKTAGV
ncbi:MAG: hypothetical protein ACREB9_07460 [Thermoplasmata archaeon]